MEPVAPPVQVHVVDDDPVVLRSITRLLDAAGIATRAWSSPDEFLRLARPEPPCCILLDVRMPGRTGPEVQEDLRRQGSMVPVVFLTAHADVPTTVRAMKGGADDFLLKPVEPPRLLEVVRGTLARSRELAGSAARGEDLRRCLASLTPRERDVLGQVARGASNREGAEALSISENTFKVHRLRVMEKMEASSLADLVRRAVALGLVPPG